MEEIKIGGIYQHFKGDYYFVKDIATSPDTGEQIIIYNKCDENGIFKIIRVQAGDREIIQDQPFWKSINSFCDLLGYNLYSLSRDTPRYKFIKMRRDYETNL